MRVTPFIFNCFPLVFFFFSLAHGDDGDGSLGVVMESLL